MINLDIKLIKLSKADMQKIKRGLQQKLNLISKIQNNLKIKKFDLKKSFPKNTFEFPNIERNQTHHEKEDHPKSSIQAVNPQIQIERWINIKRIEKDQKLAFLLSPNYTSRKRSDGLEIKQSLASSYTSRFTSKNSPTKIVQFRTLVGDLCNNNTSTQMLRKTYFDRTSCIFSVQKQQKLKPLARNPLQKDSNFYGKINQINHIAGSRFKTLDPRFGGLTRQQLKEKIKSRVNLQEKDILSLHKTAIVTSSLNMYEIEASYNQKGKNSAFSRYNFISNEDRTKPQKTRRRKQSKTKDRYSPWNDVAEEVVWDQLPKIK